MHPKKKEKNAEHTPGRSVTSEFELVIKELDETVERDQNAKEACSVNSKKLKDSIPPTRSERLKK